MINVKCNNTQSVCLAYQQSTCGDIHCIIMVVRHGSRRHIYDQRQNCNFFCKLNRFIITFTKQAHTATYTYIHIFASYICVYKHEMCLNSCWTLIYPLRKMFSGLFSCNTSLQQTLYIINGDSLWFRQAHKPL